jgi:hypothetical protein
MFDKNNKNQLLDEHLTDILDETTAVDQYIWVRALVFLVIGTLVGGISVLFRPYFNDGVHLEALAALVIMIGLNIGLLAYFVRHKRKRYKFAYLLSVCAVWIGYVVGWSIGAGYLWEDVWMASGWLAFMTLGFGYLVFYIQDNKYLMGILNESISLDRYIWIRAGVFLVISTLVSGVSVLFRPYFNGEVQVDALVSLIIMVGLNIGLLIYFVRQKRKRYKLAYLLSVCAISTGYVVGWSIVAGYVWEDILMAGGWLTFMTLCFGSFVFYIRDNEYLMRVINESISLDRYIWIRAGVFLVISALVGGISVLFRPYFNEGVQVDALVSLIVLIGLNIGLLIYFVRQKRKRYNLAYTLSVCAIWMGHFIGWSIGAGYIWEDVFGMNGLFALAALGIGYVVFFIYNKRYGA